MNNEPDYIKNETNYRGVNVMKIEIDRKEYDRLLDRDRMLEALENGGVANWEWYSDSLEQYNKEKELQKEKEMLKSLLSDIFYDGMQDIFLSAYEPSEKGAGLAFDEKPQEKLLNCIVDKIIGIKAKEQDNG